MPTSRVTTFRGRCARWARPGWSSSRSNWRARPSLRWKPGGNQVETITGKRSRLYRRFGLPDGRVVVLSEHDMLADHIHTWRDPKDEPERIGTLPARLVVLQTPSGKAISSLTWLEGRRDYELWVDANAGVDRALRERMFTLAASLPPSKPACPNEALYTPVPLGPDGFPQDGPAPKVLTSADIDAIDHPPCK
jgi:hypothetical protein